MIDQLTGWMTDWLVDWLIAIYVRAVVCVIALLYILVDDLEYPGTVLPNKVLFSYWQTD